MLRLDFTQHLIKALDKQSLNVYAPHGQGQLRLLEDLKITLVKQGDITLLIKMKSYAESYSGFIQALAVQTAQQIPTITSDQLTDFSAIITAWDEHAKQQRIVMMLHDFDAILDNPQIDEAYDISFFDSLNALRNQGRRLICMTKKPHNQSQVYVDKKVHSNSWLDLERIELPLLTYDEIKHALFPHNYQLSSADENRLIDTVKKHPQSYQFLVFVQQKLELKDAEHLTLKVRLKRWNKKFVQREKSTAFKGLHRVRQWTTCLAVITGINQLKTPFTLLITILQKIVGKSA
jgi:hypothetical protein